MKTVKNIKEVHGTAEITLSNGVKKTVPIKTVYTYYTDNTNDCTVMVDKPIDLVGKSKQEDK